MQNDELLPVTQADRERAASFMDECTPYLGDCGMKNSVHLALVQAFARHRTAHSGEDRINEAGEDDNAIDEIAALRAENARLRDALVNEREENLWNAYSTGRVRDGKWDHLCMSDGEWLARECGFNVSDRRFDDGAVRDAIPKAARNILRSLKQQPDGYG